MTSASSIPSSSDSPKVEHLEQKVKDLQEQLDSKVQSSSQMKNMQKILKDKNALIDDLRKQLES